MQRSKQGVPVVALVGYTNAGKSTLLNKLTGADVYAANQLFATLDPTTRRLALPGGKSVLLSDTVGFIQKLPTTLIAAFRATLEEVIEADIILHVVDVAHPNVRQQIETVEDTLAEIELPRLPRILALNKVDLLHGEPIPPLSDDPTRLDNYLAVVPLSARSGRGLDQLMVEIENVLREAMVPIDVTLPYKRGDVISVIHQQGVVDLEEHQGDGVHLKAHVPPRLAALLREER